MRRSILLTLALLGALVSVVGGLGLFAALNDTAVTGTNAAESGSLTASADIQLATATAPAEGSTQIQCGTFADNLATAIFDVADVGLGYTSETVYVCVKNAGSQTITLSMDATELSDVETDCTGDEALNGDTSCGDQLAGELSGVLSTRAQTHAMCEVFAPNDEPAVGLGSLVTTPASFAQGLGPGQTACIGIVLTYPGDTSAVLVQKAQSDRVTWRYRFNAAA